MNKYYNLIGAIQCTVLALWVAMVIAVAFNPASVVLVTVVGVPGLGVLETVCFVLTEKGIRADKARLAGISAR